MDVYAVYADYYFGPEDVGESDLVYIAPTKKDADKLAEIAKMDRSDGYSNFTYLEGVYFKKQNLEDIILDAETIDCIDTLDHVRVQRRKLYDKEVDPAREEKANDEYRAFYDAAKNEIEKILYQKQAVSVKETIKDYQNQISNLKSALAGFISQAEKWGITTNDIKKMLGGEEITPLQPQNEQKSMFLVTAVYDYGDEWESERWEDQLAVATTEEEANRLCALFEMERSNDEDFSHCEVSELPIMTVKELNQTIEQNNELEEDREYELGEF